MNIQRAIGIMMLLSITLLVIPNLKNYMHFGDLNQKVNFEKYDKSINENNNIETTTLSVSPKINNNINTNDATKIIEPLESKILASVSKKTIDFDMSSIPDLPETFTKKIRKKQFIGKINKPILMKSNNNSWIVMIASFKSSEPFVISGFKQILKRKKIPYNSYKHIINKTKWVRFSSKPLNNRKKAEQLRDYINNALKSLKLHAVVMKNK